METILSETRPTRAEKEATISKLSLQLNDSSKSKNISRGNRDDIERSHLKQESRRATRYHHNKGNNEVYWSNDDSEENDDNDLEKTSTKESKYQPDILETQASSTEERNNNVNFRRGHSDHGQVQPSLIGEDEMRVKKKTHEKDKSEANENCRVGTSDSPPTPLPSPSATNQGSSVVDAVAGTSASVAVNSFLKFSIQNILQVIIFRFA